VREGAYSQLDLVAIGCDVICAIFFVSILPTIGGLSSPATLHKYHFPVAGTDETLQTRGLADLGKIELPTSLETNASARERRGKVSPRRCRAVVQREQSVTLHSRGLPLVGSRLPLYGSPSLLIAPLAECSTAAVMDIKHPVAAQGRLDNSVTNLGGCTHFVGLVRLVHTMSAFAGL